MSLRGRVLSIRGTLLAESRRLQLPCALPTAPGLLESLALELESVAEDLASLAVIDTDDSDEMVDPCAETQPIGLRR